MWIGEGFVRYQMCWFWGWVKPTMVQCGSRIDSCETGFGVEGFRSYQM